MSDVMADYTLDVYCDHSRNPLPESRIERHVARILHVDAPTGAVGFMEWREGVLPDAPDYPSALQTFYGEAMRLGTFGLRAADGSHLRPQQLVRGMTEGERWRFWCADCDDTFPVRGSRIRPYLEILRSHGLERVTLAALAATI
ncbi:hypothetical protein GCM10027039_01700 [Terrabacter koreensis]